MSLPSNPTGLAYINSLPADAAHEAFLKCCHAPRWAAAGTSARPFASLTDLLEGGILAFDRLSKEEMLGAISAHPRIGQRTFDAPSHAATAAWSSQEQSGMAAATDAQREAFIAGNRAYEQKFGHVFLICATHRTASWMLAELHRRMANDADAELREAARELKKIMIIRLSKLAEGL